MVRYPGQIGSKNHLIRVIYLKTPKILVALYVFEETNKQILSICFLFIYYIIISGGPLSALTCCVNARLLSAIKKISPLIYSQSWVGSWVYITQAMMTFTLIF